MKCIQPLNLLSVLRDSYLFQHVIMTTHARGDQTHTLDVVLTNEEAMIERKHST